MVFTKAIEIDPENIPAYMGRATAYRGAERYDEARADYTTVISKTTEQPYIQAEAYMGRAEVSELTGGNETALEDYQSAAAALEKVEIEKLADVTEQMLEALKIKVYNACARLSAFFGQHESAVTAYTSALKSLQRLPDGAEILDVPAEKTRTYTGRIKSNLKLEAYEAVLSDYDTLIELGEDRAIERDTLLAALSLAKSEAADLGQTNDWLAEAEHPEYAEQIGLEAMANILQQAATIAQESGEDAYGDIYELMADEKTQEKMCNLLALGYQLRWYDEANGKMLAIYAGETAWPDVNEEKTGSITAERLDKPAKEPTEEELAAVILSPLYVYYGGYEGRSREGEGLWYIFNPDSREYEAHSYEWKNDVPTEGFEQAPEGQPTGLIVNQPVTSTEQPVEQSKKFFQKVNYTTQKDFPSYLGYNNVRRVTTVACDGYKIILSEQWSTSEKLIFEVNELFFLSQPLAVADVDNSRAVFYVPVGTVITNSNDLWGIKAYAVSGKGQDQDGFSLTMGEGEEYRIACGADQSYKIYVAAR